MTFLSPNALYLFFFVAVTALLAIYIWQRRRLSYQKLISPRLQRQHLRSRPVWFHLFTLTCLLLALSNIIISLGDPVGDDAEISTTPHQAHQIILCLDTSRSMTTKDISPNRLAAAKLAALDIIKNFPRDQIGLILYSGEASLQIPLTLDHGLLQDAITQSDTQTLPVGGSNLTAALALAAETFSEQPTQNHTLIVLGDGEEHDDGLETLARILAEQKTNIHALGFGTLKGDDIPDENDPEKKFRDREGRPVLSQLRETTLKAIAKETNGLYSRGTTPEFLAQLSKSVAQTDTKLTEEEKLVIASPLYQWFLLPAIIFVMISYLPNLLFKPHKATLLAPLILLATISSPSLQADPLKKYHNQEYLEAANEFSTLAKKHKKENAARYSLAAAAAYYKTGHYSDALSHYSKALLTEDPTLLAEAYYSLGNTLYQLGNTADNNPRERWTEACEKYQTALLHQPNHQKALENFNFLKNKLNQLPPEKDPSEKKTQNPNSTHPPKNTPTSQKQNDSPPPNQTNNPPPPPPTDPDNSDNPTQNDPKNTPPPQNSKIPKQPNESPQDYARRMLKAADKPGDKKTTRPPPLIRPAKDW